MNYEVYTGLQLQRVNDFSPVNVNCSRYVDNRGFLSATGHPSLSGTNRYFTFSPKSVHNVGRETMLRNKHERVCVCVRVHRLIIVSVFIDVPRAEI